MLPKTTLLRWLCKKYGLNKRAVKLLMCHGGYSYSCKVSDIYEESDNWVELKNLLVDKEYQLGSHLYQKKISDIGFNLKLKNYKGYCLRNHLPLRGQRKRSNARNAKKFNRS